MLENQQQASPSGVGERKIALWIPDWSVAALTSAVPPGSPAVTVQSGTVKESTRSARLFGIRRGMRQSTAQHICVDLIVLPHDEVRDASEFERVLQVFDTLFAEVTAVKPGLAWAPLYQEAKWQVDERKKAEDLAEQVTSVTGLEAFIGIGDGAAAAAAAARRGKIIPRGKSGSFLAGLSLGELLAFLPEEAKPDYEPSLRLLHLLGVKNVQHLLDLGRKQVVGRLGDIGKKLWTLATSGDLFVSSGTEFAPLLETHHEFSPPVSQVEQALVGARRVASAFTDLMQSQGVIAQTLHVTVEMSTGVENTRRWTLFNLAESTQVAQRIIWQIRSWQSHLEQETDLEEESFLTGVRLLGTDITRSSGTDTLWGAPPRAETVSQAIAHVQLLLGEEAVVQPRIQGGLSPRERMLLQPWGADPFMEPREGEWAGAVQETPLLLFDSPPLAKLFGLQNGREWGQIWSNARGILNGESKRIVVLEDRPELVSGAYQVRAVTGLWPVKGTWWSTPSGTQETKFFLRIRVFDQVDFLLVQWGSEWKVEGLYTQLTSG